MVASFLFKDRNGQTPLPDELHKGLKIKNIQTIGELDEHEEDNITEGILWLRKAERDYKDYKFWLMLHKKLFGTVWSWAGKVRKHELNNPDFLSAHQIWPAFIQLEGDLNYWISNPSFSKIEIAARFHEAIETIHPFANGNGRFGRILIEYFCNKEQINLPTWGASLKENQKLRRNSYIESLDEARRRKTYERLIRFMFSE